MSHNKLNTCHIIEQFIQVHGNKYDYSFVDYEGANKKVRIICPEHGEFEQTAITHKRGSGCPKCAQKKRNKKQMLSLDLFIEKANKTHNYIYNYSKVKFESTKDKVTIICPYHGEFEQQVNVHYRGSGCPKCGLEKLSKINSDTVDSFIKKANKVHGGKYGYSKVKYNNSHSAIEIICKKHGSFWQLPHNHLNSSSGCPKCSNNGQPSLKEQELYEFVKGLIYCEQSNKTILNNKELDIFIPSRKIAIEFNGLEWHSDKYKDKNYHLNKTNMCLEKGIQLIHIFEDEWLHKKEIVKSRLRNILNLTENKIYARKCEIKEVSSKDTAKFLNENHIQGNVGSKIKLGLYYNGDLVSLMTFGGLRKNLGSKQKENHYELLRFCNKINTNVVGGFSKLLKYFQSNNEWVEIISYCDNRWSLGNVYLKNGFNKIGVSSPNYFYYKSGVVNRLSRFKYRKSELIKQGFDKNKSEREIMKERGFLRVYDCGTTKYSINSSCEA